MAPRTADRDRRRSFRVITSLAQACPTCPQLARQLTRRSLPKLARGQAGQAEKVIVFKWLRDTHSACPTWSGRASGQVLNSLLKSNRYSLPNLPAYYVGRPAGGQGRPFYGRTGCFSGKTRQDDQYRVTPKHTRKDTEGQRNGRCGGSLENRILHSEGDIWRSE